MSESCLLPASHVSAAGFRVPHGAWDTHIHAIGAPDRFALARERSYTPAIVPIDAYVQLMDALGLARAVLVQPSIYGTDNAAMVDALQRFPARFRGVAVVAADVTDAALDTLHGAGVRGVRANLLNRGGISLADALALVPRLASRGWHLQLQIDVSTFDAFDVLARLSVPLVIDHVGYMAADKGPRNPGFRRLVSLVEAGRCFVKLSAPYRLVDWRRNGFGAVGTLARTLIDANADRILWGSDWPHTDLRHDMPDDGELLGLLARWAPAEAVRRRVLVDNPALLYGS